MSWPEEDGIPSAAMAVLPVPDLSLSTVVAVTETGNLREVL